MKSPARSVPTTQPLTPAPTLRSGARGIFIAGCSLTLALAWALPAGAVTIFVACTRRIWARPTRSGRSTSRR